MSLIASSRIGEQRRVSILDVKVHPTNVLAPMAITVLLFAGYLKATPLLSWFPLDLTLIGAVGVTLGIVVRQIRLRTHIPAGVVPTVILWATFVPGWLVSESNSYSDPKIARLFSLTLLSTLGPIYLLNTDRRRRVWCWTFVLVGAVAVGMATISPDAAQEAVQRLSAQGSGTIEIGRAAGVAVLVLCVGAATRAVPLLVAIPAMIFFASAAALTGSRGPLLAAVISLLLVALMKPGTAKQRIGRFAAGGAIVALLTWLVGSISGGAVVWQRTAGLFSNGVAADQSSQARLTLNEFALAQIPHAPFGIGWGDLREHIPLAAIHYDGYFDYTHNAITETTLEAGWLAGVALVVFIIVALRRLALQAITPTNTVLLAIGTYFVANAMVSGDINGNRTMFAALAVSWTLSTRTSSEGVGERGQQRIAARVSDDNSGSHNRAEDDMGGRLSRPQPESIAVADRPGTIGDAERGSVYSPLP